MNLEYEVASFCVQGRRSRIEDSFQVNTAKGLFVVADGVAGARCGDQASRFAVESIMNLLVGHDYAAMAPTDISQVIYKSMVATSTAVYGREFTPDPSLDEYRRETPQTTLTVAVLTDTYLIHGNVGDSRGYILSTSRPDLARQRRKSATTTITLEEVTTETSQFVGGMLPLLPIVGVHEIRPTDIGFLLCTDGFYKEMEHRGARNLPEDQSRRLSWSCDSSPEAQQQRERSLRQLQENTASPFLGKIKWRKKEGIASLVHQKSLQQSLYDLEVECLAAGDNVTVIYGRFKNRQVSL